MKLLKNNKKRKQLFVINVKFPRLETPVESLDDLSKQYKIKLVKSILLKSICLEIKNSYNREEKAYYKKWPAIANRQVFLIHLSGLFSWGVTLCSFSDHTNERCK